MKQVIKFSLLSFFLSIYFLGVNAEIKLAAIFSDNMVLQQQADDPVWGWASPGEQITVQGSWKGSAPVKAITNSQGKWMIKIKTPVAGGPYTLTVSGNKTIILHNVMIGEVWVCSGQSNMEFPLTGWPGAPMIHSAEEIKAAQYPDIRLFTVARHIAFKPQDNCIGAWSECNPQTAKSFSATAYFFGRNLYRKLKIPIGLISTNWGGTVAEAWTSESALRKLGDFNKDLNRVDSIRPHLQQIKEQEARNLKTWKAEMNRININYAGKNFDDAGWKTMQLPAHWESAGLPNVDGVVWFRKIINVPASWSGKDLTLSLGPIDDEDITWFDGQKIGGIQKEGFWAKNRSYNVPGKFVKAGKNVIAVRVTDLQGSGGIYGDQKLMKLYLTGNSGKAISIAGDWQYKLAIKKPQTQIGNNPNRPTVLYNGMIAPLIPFGIRGAIWYQGEANVGRAAQYARLFPAMITDWRSLWKEGNFPFYFVQIAPYPYGGNGTQAAALRDAQRRALKLPNAGMAVTLDIGDTTNIHPADKQDVGKRLSLWALTKIYGKKNIVYSGPLYKSMKITDNKIILSFDHTDGGLVAKGGKLGWFQIAGSDGHFVPAKAKITGNQVVVQSDKIMHPKAVRYAWYDNAIPHLFNKAGLPAATFSTEE